MFGWKLCQYANIHTVSVYITGHEDRYAANADTLNLLSFLRLILLSCTTYSYVYLFGCYSDRKAENNRKTLKSMPRRRRTQTQDGTACFARSGVQCRTNSYNSFLIVYVSQESQLTYFLLVTLLAGEVFERKSYRVATGTRSG